MAKICFTAISNVFFTKDEFMDSFVEQFANSLIRAGNDVLYIQCNRLIAEPLSNKCRDRYDEKGIISEIVSFNPDFVITFNNVFPCA
ncbi:MAG: hypothetical protein IJ479_00035, partial [Alphaproteobacteria bacterium]|nr:hypothetical protein [Alphaproteobacteria bacterium]